MSRKPTQAVRYVTQGKWIEIKKQLWAESILGIPICAYCGKRNANELAHALLHKRYGKSQHHKYVNVRENAAPCCFECQKASETKNGRQIAWDYLCIREGGEHMRTWYDNVPMLIKEIFP